MLSYVRFAKFHLFSQNIHIKPLFLSNFVIVPKESLSILCIEVRLSVRQEEWTILKLIKAGPKFHWFPAYFPLKWVFKHHKWFEIFCNWKNKPTKITFYSIDRGPPNCPSGRMDYNEFGQGLPNISFSSIQISHWK